MLLALTTAFTFLFGAIVGSFLNVVIYRLPRGESVATPASHCPSCETPIKWYDNVPILSWLLLGGKCRSCEVPISPKYILVEALLGLMASMLWLKLAAVKISNDPFLMQTSIGTLAALFLLYFTFVCLCVTLAFIDLKHLIVPHILTIPGILLGIASPWIVASLVTYPELEMMWPPITPLMSLLGAIVGALVVLVIFAIYYVMRGIPGLGGGDLTLMALMGAWLGWPALYFIFIAASIQGLVATLISQKFDLGLTYDAEEVFETEGAMNLGTEESKPESDENSGAEEENAPVAKIVDAETGEEITTDTTDEEEQDGPLAIPFGPFIVLAALEYFYLGRMMPDSISMYVLYSY